VEYKEILDQLYKEILDLKQVCKELKEENIALKLRVKTLEKENQKLKEKLHKKNSKNSSMPPSKDENRIKSNQSLRKRSERKSGGQPGHKGNVLLAVENRTGYRQVIDIPQIQPIVTQHEIYSASCRCGHTTKANYPKEASSPISYGNTIEATISYLSVRQYMPTKRIEEHLRQLYGLSITEGTIINKLRSYAKKCLPIYEQIRGRIERSNIVGGDETGCVVNGKKMWMWTWQNSKLTYIALSNTRGYKAITDNYPNGLVNAILVSDCWAAQLKTQAKAHQLCTAHLQRELNYLIELGTEKWSIAFLKLIQKALKLKYKILDNPTRNFKKEISNIIAASDQLLAKNIRGHKKLLALKKRLLKNKDSIWNFLRYQYVPPDNNGSERAIRNIKVKQKISGQFKSFQGGQHFAVVRSVIDTIIKSHSSVYETMIDIPNFRLE